MPKIIPIPKFIKRFIKVLVWIFGTFAILSICLSLLLLIPSVQQFALNKATNFVSNKTGMKARVGSVHISFPKTIKLGDIYLGNQQIDTVFFCQEIAINAAIFPLLRQKIHIDYLKIHGIKAQISQGTDSTYNFSPMMRAFAGSSDTTKKSTENPWEISLDELELQDVQANYFSQIDSSFFKIILGELDIVANIIDVPENKFDLEKISLSNTSISMEMGNIPTTTEPAAANDPMTIPINLGLKELNVENFHFDMTANHRKFDLTADLREINLKPGTIDLPNTTISLDKLQADGVMVNLKLLPEDYNETPIETHKTSSLEQVPSMHTFGDFGWKFFIEHAAISNTAYTMDLGHELRLEKSMDYEHMALTNISLTADSLFFDREATGFSVSSFTIKDISGPEISHISGKFFMDNAHISGEKILLQTPTSFLEGSMTLGYPALSLIGSDIGMLEITSDIKGKIQMEEIQPFSDFMETYPMLQNIKSVAVKNFVSHGFLKDFTIDKIAVSLADSTYFDGRINISGLPNARLNFDYSIDTLFTTRGFLEEIISDTLLPSTLQFPEKIGFKSAGKTDLVNGQLNADLWTDFGSINANIELNNQQISAKIDIPCFDVGALISNEFIGEISLESDFEAKLIENTLGDFTTNTEIFSMVINQKTIFDSRISLRRDEEIYHLQTIFSDSAINGSLTGSAKMMDSTNHLTMQFDLDHLDLRALNLIKDDFTINGNMSIETDFASLENVTGTYRIEKLNLRRWEKVYHVDEIHLNVDMQESYTNFNLTSDILDATLTGNTRIADLQTAIIDHLGRYLSLPDSLLSDKEYIFQFDLKIKKPDFFTAFLIDDLNEFSLEQFHAKYDNRTNLFEAAIVVPKVVYGKLTFDDLAFHISSKTDSTVSQLQLRELSYDSAIIKNIKLKAKIEEQHADFSLLIRDIHDSLKYKLGVEASFRDSIYIIALNPEEIIIDHHPWTVNPDNALLVSSNKIMATNAQLSHQDQKIWLQTIDDTIRLNFEQFGIQNISGLLEKDRENRLLKGNLNGYVEGVDLFGNFFLASELSVSNLLWQNNPLGDLNASMTYDKNAVMNFALELKNDINVFSAVGELSKRENVPYININVESAIQNAEAFQPLVDDYVTGLKGGVAGRFSIFGPTEKPTIYGSMDFNDLELTLSSFNTILKNSGKIIINENIVNFKDFTIRDDLNNSMNISGTIDINEIGNPNYNMQVSTKDFMAINSFPQHNKTIQGKLLLGADISISGKQDKLVVLSSFSINNGTDIMYIMPGKDLELITDKGIVEFIDFEQADRLTADVATKQFVGDSIISTLKGIDLTTKLKIDPGAKFSVFVDPNSGDITTFKLKGDLQYKYNNVQRGNLTGLLELEEGFYNLSFYGLVKKEFVYDKGSRVSWSGNVMNGEINFSARHGIMTNSLGLVANEISSSEKSMYSQRLPYEVILYVTDQISNPRISFGIDLQDNQKSNNPIIDSKLKMLNMPSMESERNKQVFALLVGGTFIPDNPGGNEGGSSRNFATTAAINSVNSIMTQQLNNLTSQYIKVVDLDLGLNTFDEYNSGTTETKTQLDVKVSKNLFNERVSAEVESHINLDGSNQQPGQQSNTGMPEFAVSYNMTESGNYRIKMFRENGFDFYDGEIQNSGLAFIFVREFDSFRKKKKKTSTDSSSPTPSEDDPMKK